MVYPHAMSAPEEISYNALQWMWLNIKFVTSQALEILAHFKYPCTARAYLVMLACLLISVVEVTKPCFIIYQVIEGARQICITTVMSLIPSS